MNRLIPKGLKARMGFGTTERKSSVARTSGATSVHVRVPGVRARVPVTLGADDTIGSVVAAARAAMPANHLNALQRYEPFRLW